MPRSCRLLSRLLLLALALSAGCASLPPPPKAASQALVDVDDTPLARIAAASLLAGLADHANVELRIFNPFAVRRGSPAWRILGSLDGFLINHRMHNQLFIADSPDKAAGGSGPTVAQQVLALFASAQQYMHIASPYFIPGGAGLRLLRAAGATQDNGCVVLVTNSIGAADEPRAHAACAQQRLAMLQAGVRIYEVGAELGTRVPRSGGIGASHSALHAKVATVDGRWLFIGSINLDPRSAPINAEIGLLIDSPPLARTMTALSRRSLVYDANRLRLSADGRHIEWLEPRADGSTTVHAVEPGGHWGQRLQIRLLQPFVATRLLQRWALGLPGDRRAGFSGPAVAPLPSRPSRKRQGPLQGCGLQGAWMLVALQGLEPRTCGL